MAGISVQGLPNYPENVDVTVEVPFIDDNGSPVNGILSVSYRVLDESSLELVPLTAIAGFTPGATDGTVTVPASINVLPVVPPVPLGQFNTGKQQLRAFRTVELQMTTPAGIFVTQGTYIIAKQDKLVLLDNSFQTYQQALLTCLDMPRMPGFEAASDGDRIQALSEAYFRLTRLGYRVRHPSFVDSPPAGGRDFWPDMIIPPRYWQVMDLVHYALYLPEFRTALCRAQVAEANIILAGDPIQQRRRDGLLSETIGQSSMMFRSGKPLSLPISNAALNYVTNYVELRMTTTRA